VTGYPWPRSDHVDLSLPLRRRFAHTPQNVDILHNLAAIALDGGDVAIAIRGFLRVLHLHADNLSARYNLSLAALRLATPEHVDAWTGIRPWRRVGGRWLSSDLEAATWHLSQVINTDPGHLAAHLSLGVALQALGRPREARRHDRCALALSPAFVEALNNLGGTHADELDRETAEPWLRRALAVAPSYAEGWNNLASLVLNTGRPGPAIAAAEQALRLRPTWAEPAWNLALAALTLGDYERGWDLYEARWRLADADPAGAVAPAVLWDGRLANGHEVVVRAEQGFGDMLQFVRYLPLLAAQGVRVVLECHDALRPLLADAPGVSRTVPIGDLPAGLPQVPLLSLPRLAQTRLESIPAAVPYLAPPQRYRDRWQRRLSGLPRPIIGLCWQGNPAFRRDIERSPGWVPFRRLLSTQTATFVGMVKAQDKAPDGADFVQLGPELVDFADSAAAMEEIDLLISSDTSIVHLAGALGRPAWVLLHHAADWRWLRGREDSPWYPSLRLFRQTIPGDWTSVVGRVAEELRRYGRS
jgi:tetratricopeptide (TPR) repeat protein